MWTQRCIPASTEPLLHDLRLRAVLVQMNGMGLSSESSRVSSARLGIFHERFNHLLLLTMRGQ